MNVKRMTSKKIFVDVISDTICPWCYVGKRRLEKAMAMAKKDNDIDFEVRWRPYFLNPHLPKEPQNKRELYYSKFGKERFEAMQPRMEAVGKEEGINFSYGGMIANTRDSHRLVEYAFEKGGSEVENKMVDILFKGYFELERNIGDIEFLVEAAAEAGLDPAEVRAFLESDAGSREVDMNVVKYGRKFRVTGVPHFVFSDSEGPKHAVGGAQDPASLLAVINEVAQES